MRPPPSPCGRGSHAGASGRVWTAGRSASRRVTLHNPGQAEPSAASSMHVAAWWPAHGTPRHGRGRGRRGIGTALPPRQPLPARPPAGGGTGGGLLDRASAGRIWSPAPPRAADGVGISSGSSRPGRGCGRGPRPRRRSPPPGPVAAAAARGSPRRARPGQAAVDGGARRPRSLCRGGHRHARHRLAPPPPGRWRRPRGRPRRPRPAGRAPARPSGRGARGWPSACA